MLIKFQQDTVRRTPPGLGEPYFVEFCTMNRAQRDDVLAAMMLGQGGQSGTLLLAYGISAFRLPSDRGDETWTAEGGDGGHAQEIYLHLDAELADWCATEIIELNGLLPSQRERVDVVLGNSGGASGDSSVDSASGT